MRIALYAAGLAACAVLSGCVSARVSQFSGFAQAGVAYVKASQTVLDEAGTAAVRNDSSVLRATRTAFSSDERRDRLARSNELLRQRLVLLKDVGRHGRLLQGYFETLAAMADSKNPEPLAKSASGVYDSISKLGTALRGSSIGTASVSSFMPDVAAPVVAALKVRALDAELRARSKAIAEELGLQEAVFKAIASDLRTDTKARINLEETQDVIAPYIGPRELPSDWASHREQVLFGSGALDRAEAASGAAKKLRECFNSLVQNRLDRASLSSLAVEINALLSLADHLQKAAL